jgi:hypothetical protein
MNRRKFIKTIAVGSAAIAILPGVISPLATASSDDEGGGNGLRRFQFVAFSHAGTLDRVAMNGEGTFEVHSSDDITGKGEGSWIHFDPASPVPPVAFGKWKTEDFVSYDPTTLGSPPVGIFGRIQASKVVMEVNLLREFPTPDVIPAKLEIVCNIGVLGSAGFTGVPEGYTLAIPGTPFAEGGTPGPFVPFVPARGLTHTSIAEETDE